jgi:hypothetical protein
VVAWFLLPQHPIEEPAARPRRAAL